MDIIALGSSFLQLPHEIRCNAYKKVGVICSGSIHRFTPSPCQIPGQIPVAFHFSSKELLADALSVFWSENRFKLYCVRILEPLNLGTLMMWSSVRDLTIISAPSYLPHWRQVCNNLGVYMPPSQLTIHFCVNILEVPIEDHADTARDALHSMLALPVLKKMTFIIAPVSYLGVDIHRMATYIVKRHICQSVERRSPVLSFRFMNLPVEIQLLILEYTDLVAPGPVTASTLKGYVLNDCYTARRCPRPALWSIQFFGELLELAS